jgi:AcrR family transcriptional regulator
MPTDLRRRVLDASLAIVAAHGPAALSLREVARRAGVSHQAPYKHFPDREAILAALVTEAFEGLAGAMDGAMADVAEPSAALVAAGRAYVRWARANPGSWRLLFRPDMVALDRYPEARAAGGRAFAVLQRGVGALSRAPSPGGHPLAVLGDPEAEVRLALAWSTVQGLAALLVDGPLPMPGSSLDADALAEAVPALLGQAVEGLEVEGGRRRET